MDTRMFEDWSATEGRALDDRRVERERVAAIEAHIEVREWHDAAERAAFLREYGA
jgi:hypothetical protein